jgi:hypothetical protein
MSAAGSRNIQPTAETKSIVQTIAYPASLITSPCALQGLVPKSYRFQDFMFLTAESMPI